MIEEAATEALPVECQSALSSIIITLADQNACLAKQRDINQSQLQAIGDLTETVNELTEAVSNFAKALESLRTEMLHRTADRAASPTPPVLH